jgi:hypothetical protein
MIALIKLVFDAMTPEERETLIEYIKENDSTYNYNAVNFKYYTDEDLLVLKKRLDHELRERKKQDGGQA